MKDHYTPEHLLSLIRKHLPRQYSSVLEPSVGDGSLLNAIQKSSAECSIVALDIDEKVLSDAKSYYSNNAHCVRFLHGNFLEWKAKDSEVKEVDLVLMNPPFNAKRSNWVDYSGKKLPIEMAFVYKAMEHCKEGGDDNCDSASVCYSK